MPKQYKFAKGFFDTFDPTIVKGKAIKDGAIVTVVKENFDPMKKFVWIEDEEGNVQSTYKTNIKPITQGEDNE